MKRVLFLLVIGLIAQTLFGQLIVDHRNTDIRAIPLYRINQAKSNLHIAYGHTSHGSQLIDGMDGLVTFANNGGMGLNHPINTFSWSNGGEENSLDLHDYAMEGDCGYYPDWYNNTIAYLGSVNEMGKGSLNPDVNVVIWSWCGQIDDKYAAGTLDAEYIVPMNTLESMYYGVCFVYMTGHVDHWDDANNEAANQYLRNYCLTNSKTLYDFTDIESYDPDGIYYEFPGDDCSYYASVDGELLGNWATNWQESHTENVDWYTCGAAHSQPLNANRKAYAAWWLWASLAGWSTTADQLNFPLNSVSEQGFLNQTIKLQFTEDHPQTGINVVKVLDDSVMAQSLPNNLIALQNSYYIITSSSGNVGQYNLTFNTTGMSDSFHNFQILKRNYGNSFWQEIINDSTITVVYNDPYITIQGLDTFSEFVLARETVENYDLTIQPVILDNIQNYPNPFNPTTTIQFNLKKQSHVKLNIYNLKGQLVKSLFDGNKFAGQQKIVWNGKDNKGQDISSGLYLYRIETDKTVQTKRMLLLK